MKKEYLEGGRICAPHGVRGLVKADPWCDSPAVLAAQKRVFFKRGEEYDERRVLSASVAGALVIMQIEGVDSRDAAQALKNTLLYLRRDDVPRPAGTCFIADILGLPVIDASTGRVYGLLDNVSDAARGKLYEVRTDNGMVYIPDRPEFIKKIDEEHGVFITPIPGFFD